MDTPNLLPALAPVLPPTAAVPDRLPCIGKSGQTLILPPGSPTPTLTVNGTAVPVTPGIMQADGAAFDLYTLATPINPGDVVIMTQGTQITLVRNSAGVIEYPVPPITMQLGMMVAHPQIPSWQTLCSPRNWAVRIPDWTPTPLAVDAAGLPTQISGKTVGVFLEFTFGNGIDGTLIPNLLGLYSLVYDAIDLATVLEVEGLQGTGCTYRADLSSPGVNGVGIVKVYEVTAAPGRQCAQLQVAISHPANTPKIANLWISPPGNPIDRTDALAVETSIQQVMSIGQSGPYALRFMDSMLGYGGQSNAVNPGDQTGIDRSSWVPIHPGLHATITAIRPVTVPGTIQTVNGSLTYTDLSSWAFGRHYVIEIETAEPHGFTTGQTGTLTTPATLSGTAAGAGIGLTNGATLQIFVTSPTTFVCSFYAGDLPTPGTQAFNLDAPIPLPSGATITANVAIPGGGVLPPEFCAHFASQYPDCACWCNFPLCGTDAMATEWAQRIGPYLGSTNSLIIEVGNEAWNWFAPGFNFNWTLSKLQGDGRYGLYTARRTLEVTKLFQQAFAALGLPNPVRSVFCWQLGDMTDFLRACAGNKLVPDAVATAPYLDPPYAWGTKTAAWTMPQHHDLCRANIIYGYGGEIGVRQQGNLTEFQHAVETFEAAVGKRMIRLAYEFGIEYGLAPGSGAAASTNFYTHPDMFDTAIVAYLAAQQAGFDAVTCESLCAGIGSDGVNFGLLNYQGQSPGTGDGRDGRLVNPTITNQWKETVSVQMEAWLRWQTAALINAGKGV